ncbi:MAG: tRNA 4-thiouridine(8) synthase ThiI [Acidobacteria bacterium]|nr:tRNA 4-thiouridine(8) synthase ThiI [Acidobacteriota bacterium]
MGQLNTSMKSAIVHYHEIALKGGNRPWFIARLVRNLRALTAELGVTRVRALMGRIKLELDPTAEWETLAEQLRLVFGIANFAQAGHVLGVDLDKVADAVLADLGDRQPGSFRVSARRADKRYPLTSPQIEREVGGRIKQAKGWTVNLSAPDLTVHLEMLTDEVYYSFGKQRGAGGLPSGVSGRVVCLLSGGIDSPVAAYRMMKRGCQVHFIHFHSYPILSKASQDKVREIARLFTRSQLRSRLTMVAFGEIQRQVVLTVPPPLRVIIYRRLMLRIADRLAHNTRARAVVTGEVVGQVASQTLENLAVINAVTRLPVLRPLVGHDKNEITDEARSIGTYPISIIPDQDCCQLFTPKHPATRATVVETEAAEAALPIDEIVESAIAEALVEHLNFPAKRP